MIFGELRLSWELTWRQFDCRLHESTYRTRPWKADQSNSYWCL